MLRSSNQRTGRSDQCPCQISTQVPHASFFKSNGLDVQISVPDRSAHRFNMLHSSNPTDWTFRRLNEIRIQVQHASLFKSNGLAVQINVPVRSAHRFHMLHSSNPTDRTFRSVSLSDQHAGFACFSLQIQRTGNSDQWPCQTRRHCNAQRCNTQMWGGFTFSPLFLVGT